MADPDGDGPITDRAASGPSRGKGRVGSWARQLLRSSSVLDELWARALHLKAVTRGLLVPLHRNEGYRPLFIVGAGRSGNTLIRRILVAGGDIHIPPETYVLGSVISLFRRSQNLGWSQQVNLILAQFEFHPEFDDFGLKLRPLVAELSRLKPSQRSLAALLNAFYQFHGASVGSGATRWGDKTPLNVYSLDRIFAVFPDARFLHMVRDGVDVAASYLQTGLMDNIIDAAHRWRTSIEAVAAFDRRHPTSCLEVRYEALVVDPIAEARRAAEFAGLRFSPEMVDALSHVEQLGDVTARPYHAEVRRPVHINSVGAGRRSLTLEHRKRLQQLIGPTLRRWNYEPAAD